MSLSELEKLKHINWSSIDWQAELKNNINSIDTIKQYVALSETGAT
ncbi:MAG: hypothetical protein OQK69_03415 [Gammaproteobacteria bacterium]|nr:hypothetical protein [Gammaproteobacteria bacterium]